MRKKKNLEARLERVGALVVREPAELRSELGRQFCNCELELGCGKGAFIVQAAAAKPETQFIAFEREENALVIAAERVLGEGLTNVRFAAVDARRLPEFFLPGEVSRLYINFCDPWPGSGYAHRRLTSPGFLEIYRRILTPDGELMFKTDNAELFAYSRRTLIECGWTTSARFAEWETDYERKFLEQCKEIYTLGAIYNNG